MDRSEREERIRQLLQTIGGAEVVMRSVDMDELSDRKLYYTVSKLQTKSLETLRRIVNGLSEKP